MHAGTASKQSGSYQTDGKRYGAQPHDSGNTSATSHDRLPRSHSVARSKVPQDRSLLETHKRVYQEVDLTCIHARPLFRIRILQAGISVLQPAIRRRSIGIVQSCGRAAVVWGHTAATG